MTILQPLTELAIWPVACPRQGKPIAKKAFESLRVTAQSC